MSVSETESMLEDASANAQAAVVQGRIVALDRARTFGTLLVVIYHSVIDYTVFGNGDSMRWLGFDLVALFCDSFFMAFMFLISGLFVHDSLARRGAAGYVRHRSWRLGVPLLISIFVLIPIAYYASFLRYHPAGTTDFNFFHFWWHMLTIGPWPSGQSWFLWVLLVFDLVAAAVWSTAPQILNSLGQWIAALRARPIAAFVAFSILSVVTYLPMHLAFGDGAWFEPGHYPFPIQTSRILLYPAFFFVGVGIGAVSLRTGLLAENGPIAKRWALWLAFAVLLLWRDFAIGLCPPQLAGGFLFASAVVEGGVRHCLCAVQRCDAVYDPGDLVAAGAVQPEPARCDAAAGLWHLSLALHFHHLAAICRLRHSASRRRQGRDRVHRYAVGKLGADRAATKDSARGADDLKRRSARAVIASSGSGGRAPDDNGATKNSHAAWIASRSLSSSAHREPLAQPIPAG